MPTDLPEVARDLAARAEHEAWKELCAFLKKSGAVTEQDIADSSPETFNLITPGLVLLNQIRNWGALAAILHVRECNLEGKDPV